MVQTSTTLSFFIGKQTGYLFSFFLFSTVLYFVLSFTAKIPVSWTYFHIFLITIPIAFLGALLARYLT